MTFPQRSFSPHISRDYTAQQNSQPVNGHRGQVEHMKKGEPCVELLRQGNGISESPVGSGAKVNRDKHVLDDHRDLLEGAEAKGHECGTQGLLYPVAQMKTSIPDARGLLGGED